jgi:pimeloyl-ACP methyl ester carboxylesterase
MTDEGPRLHGTERAVVPTLTAALSADSGPVTIMLHGFKYQPGHPIHCPHDSIFSRHPTASGFRVVSWPKALGFTGQCGEGIGLSFGWSARGSIWEAHARASDAGRALADLLTDLRRLDPLRPVNIIAHSLGARVALTAIRHAAPGAVTRAVLLAAAEYGETAREALSCDAGRATQVLNVTSRENDFYDFLMERLVAPPRLGDRMLGHGSTHLPNMVTLQLDDEASLTALARAGFPIGAPERLVCHWSPYLRSGVFDLYAAFLSGRIAPSKLRALLPQAAAPRWSRLMPRIPRLRPSGLPVQ